MGGVACSGSDELAMYGARAVESSLQKHGFDVNIVFDRTPGKEPNGSAIGLLALFDNAAPVLAVVADSGPNGAIGNEVSAWIFDTAEHAEAFQTASSSRLQNRNVVVLVGPRKREAASAALDDLGS